jgi:glycosyltransferase involved in cell wall biosynthesis
MQETFSSSTTISIITPLFNRFDLIPETWDSIKAQTYPHWEWIVVDDGSTDGSIDYIKTLSAQDKRVKLLFREDAIKGPSRCRNIGVECAQGDYLLFLDSDDIITPTCLEKRVQYLTTHIHLDFAVFTQEVFENTPGDKGLIFNKFFENNELYLKAFISDQHPWQTSGPLWKKESFIKTGGFREDYTIMEDPELHIRALIQGLQFEVVQGEPDFFYRLLPKTQEQEKAFWRNSIIGRIRFYQDLWPQLINEDQKNALGKGILNFYKTFLLARIANYRTEHLEFFQWIKKNKILDPGKIILIQCYIKCSTNKYLKEVPVLKGLTFKLI